VRCAFFAQSVVNVWNSLQSSTDFSMLSSFKRSLHGVNFNDFLLVYKSFDVYEAI